VQGEYADSTRAIAKYLTQLKTDKKAHVYICGADTVAALNWELEHRSDDSSPGGAGSDGRHDAAAATGTERAGNGDAAGVYEEVGLEFTHVFSGGDAALLVLAGQLPPSVDQLMKEE
jgi:3-phosphoglycerate kinase